jgi:hypothetical protein
MRFSLCECSFALILTGARFLATARGIEGGVYVETREGVGGAYHCSGEGGHKLWKGLLSGF